MDDNKVGKAIALLRKRAGYTQKDLAERLGISDKAVSKWERGIGLPDIGCLSRLSILLDTDTDSLLSGDVFHHDSNWVGVIVLEENTYGIYAGTIIYDKPLINYLISYFLLVGIHNITVVGTLEDKKFIEKVFGNGDDLGFRIRIVTGGLGKTDISQGNVMLVFGRCILYGVDQTRFFQKAMMNRERVTMLVLPKKIGCSFSRVSVDQNKRVINSSSEKTLKTQYDFSGIPIMFFPASLYKDICSSSSISLFVTNYASEQEIYVQMLDRGFVEIEVDNWDNVQEASTFLRIVQDKCGMNVYCVEEVAWRRGFISLEKLKELGDKQSGTEYGEYILSLYNRIKEN